MTDLRSAAIREAGAQALRRAAFQPIKPRLEWDALEPKARDSWLTWWDRIAAQLAPIIQQETVREQLRAGNASEEAEE